MSVSSFLLRIRVGLDIGGGREKGGKGTGEERRVEPACSGGLKVV